MANAIFFYLFTFIVFPHFGYIRNATNSSAISEQLLRSKQQQTKNDKHILQTNKDRRRQRMLFFPPNSEILILCCFNVLFFRLQNTSFYFRLYIFRLLYFSWFFFVQFSSKIDWNQCFYSRSHFMLYFDCLHYLQFRFHFQKRCWEHRNNRLSLWISTVCAHKINTIKRIFIYFFSCCYDVRKTDSEHKRSP